jgi:hypothetical protein
MSYFTYMLSLPSFDAHGLLPPGDYELTFEELRRSPLVVGSGSPDNTWDAAWREALVGNLETMTRQLWQGEFRRSLPMVPSWKRKITRMISTDISSATCECWQAANSRDN